MAENKRVVRLISSSHPLEVKTNMQNAEDEIEFTYSHDNTLLTMKITQEICSGSVKALCIHLVENSGKGSATLTLRVTENMGYGILCNYLKTKVVGSYDSDQDNYCWPPLLEREVVGYFCRESGPGGCFTLEKKKDKFGEVVRVKATHDFIVGEETMHVKVRIRYDNDKRGKGLNVEVEGPLKLTTEYMKHVLSRSKRRMCDAIEPSTAGNHVVESSTAGKYAVEPSTAENHAGEPSIAGNHAGEPITSGNHAVEPSTAGNHAIEPSTVGNHVVEPSTAENHVVEPSTAGNHTVEPSNAGNDAIEITVETLTTADQLGIIEASIAGNHALEPRIERNHAVEPRIIRNHAVEAVRNHAVEATVGTFGMDDLSSIRIFQPLIQPRIQPAFPFNLNEHERRRRQHEIIDRTKARFFNQPK